MTKLRTPGYEQIFDGHLLELRPWPVLVYSVGFSSRLSWNDVWDGKRFQFVSFCELDSFQEDLVEYCWIEFTGDSQ